MKIRSTQGILITLLVATLSWASSAFSQPTPNRVVSLDYCADQFALGLLPRSSIAALSMDAARDFSYMRAAAKGLPQVRPSAENVLAFQPDTVIRSYGGGPNAKKFYENLGIRVVQIGYNNSIKQVKTEIRRLAKALNQEASGAALLNDMESRLASIPRTNQPKSVLYVTPGGVTSGSQTLVDELISAAGLKNYLEQPGWRSLPLEELTLRQPELIATAFYGTSTNHKNFWSAARHPIIQREFAKTQKVALEGATTACGGWFLVDAIEILAAGAES